MANLNRVRVALTGFIGGPGVNTFYGLEAASLRAHLGNYYTALAAYLPTSVTWTIETTGDIIDPLTGDLVGTWADSSALTSSGSSSDAYAAPVGWCVNWMTGDVLDGHRLRGRTFHVPMGGSCSQNNGTLAETPLAAMRAAATAFIAACAGEFVIWHRPKLSPAHAGGYSAVTSAVINDKASVLRSRRD